jgi:hypothetical protein
MGEMVPRDDQQVFIEMDRRDQQQIVMAATGEVIDELIYTVRGRDAISWAGINHIAFWMGDIEVDKDPIWERITMFGDQVYWSVTVRARNTRYGLSSLGTAEAPELMEVYDKDEKGGKVPDGSGGYRTHLEPDPHCRRKALGMAQRNAKGAVMPRAVLTSWLSYFKRLKEHMTGKLKEEPEPPFKPKVVEADYQVRPGPRGKGEEKPRSKTGPPPGLAPGSSVTEEHIRYKLQAAGYGEALTPVRAEGGFFVVEPTRMLNDQEHYYVNAALVTLGATWVEDGGNGRWKVPGRVPRR